MKVSCNTFETFILSELSWFGRAQLSPLPNPADPGPSTQPVQQLLDVSRRVQHSPPDGHSDLLLHSAHSGVEILRHSPIPNSRNNERT